MSESKNWYQKKRYIVLLVLASLLIVQIISNFNKPLPHYTEQNKLNQISDSIQAVRMEQKTNLITSFDSVATAHNLKVTKDDFEKASFFKSNLVPNYTNTNFLYPYLVKKNDNIVLRYRIQYQAQDWLFIEDVLVRYILKNGKEKAATLFQGKFERDDDGGEIWEWADFAVSDSDYLTLLDIDKAKSVKLRFRGKQYEKDRDMTIKERKSLEQVIEAYKLIR